MVQKYSAPARIHKFPFELVMAAYECRFPTCDMIPVLVSTEVIHEKEEEDKSVQVIERRCKIKIDAPYLIKKIAGVDHVYFVQRNTLDRKNRILKIEAWNESFANRIVINEYCTYTVHPDNPEWTCFDQSASLEVKSFFGFENAVEKLAAKHYAASIKNSKEIIEVHVAKLQEECINHIDPWPAPPPEALASFKSAALVTTRSLHHNATSPSSVTSPVTTNGGAASANRRSSREFSPTGTSSGTRSRVGSFTSAITGRRSSAHQNQTNH